MLSGDRRDSRAGHGRDPSGDRVRRARAVRPRILHRTFHLHGAVPPNVRQHKAGESSNHHASGNGLHRDTNNRPPRSNLVRGPPAERAPRAAPGAAQYEFQGRLDPIQVPRLKA